MKKILALIGAIIGVLFSIWDAMVNNADTAPPDQEFGISIVSWPFFITKTIAYLLIGAILGALIGLLLEKVNKKR